MNQADALNSLNPLHPNHTTFKFIAMSQHIYINGEYFSKDDAKISVYDHGLLYGDGVFEGMRALLIEGVWRQDLLIQAFSFNLIYLSLGMFSFLFAFRLSRIHGLLLQAGE